jgi:glycosyltransferase involved in cell wall biosynthesis
MKDLSVIIPARNEELLNNTVEDVLRNLRADTEVIAVCDGSWPKKPLKDHPRLQVIHFSESVGQRAATNAGARLSQAKYIMKLDAHCAMDEGFDIKMMEDCQPDWTMVPAQYKLHAFDWVCRECGNRVYQGSEPKVCEKCSEKDCCRKEIVWQKKRHATVSWRFDKSLHFQYWSRHARRPEVKKADLIETMSFIGACMFVERERFWALGGMDEEHGSWGQFGTEWACKSWLSGGKLITTKKTWFAHMFRTGNFKRNGESTWPYPITQRQIDRARRYSRKLWLKNRWPLAKHKLEWLVEKFAPVPDWHEGAK